MKIGDKVRVKSTYDIPWMLRPGGRASEGVIESDASDVGNPDLFTVIIDGNSVPYEKHELEVIE